jgi:hypothetical protein
MCGIMACAGVVAFLALQRGLQESVPASSPASAPE